LERDHILRVLGESSWVIGGATGAAARQPQHSQPPNAQTRHQSASTATVVTAVRHLAAFWSVMSPTWQEV